ncbi:MAG: histone deacetylase [Acidobacteria bacterium]|nr:MAG: histone deacetylase [Acidobacteriota bacterium]
MQTGIIFDDLFLEHDTGPYHPECKERLISIGEALQSCPYSDRLFRLKPRPARESELNLIHPFSHIRNIQRTAGQSFTQLDSDTVASARSYEVASNAVGSILEMIDALFSGQIQNGFAFVRPPGHHAEPERAMGFCLFSNIAIGAAYALKKFKLSRVLVIDFDVHHGNGTQSAFYNQKEVLYLSTHQFPLYPGTGDFPELGSGGGKGFTVNFPLPAGCEDDTYNLIFEKMVTPIGEAYRPELVLVSAGFDAYTQDPLAGMDVTPKGFSGIARAILDLADKVCEGRVVLALEGGYHLAGLQRCVLYVLDELTRNGHPRNDWKQTPRFRSILETAKKYFNPYWKF